MFMSQYDKGKESLDLCMLTPCQDNLKLHMRRANYVPTIFNSANKLQMDLDSLLEHGWDDNLATVHSNIAFPEDIYIYIYVFRNGQMPRGILVWFKW